MEKDAHVTATDPILEAYNTLRGKLRPEIPEWVLAHVSIKAQPCATHDEVFRKLDAFGATRDAWLCTQGSVRALQGEVKRLSAECTDGRILLLEAAAGSRSLHVRLARDGWCVVEIEEVSTGGEACLAHRVELAGNPRSPGALVYRVFWKRDVGLGFVPWQARLIGFA